MSRCSAREQPVQQVAWKEQVRQEPRQLSSAEQLRPGAGCQAGLEPAGEQGLGQPSGSGQVRAWPAPSRAAAVGAQLQQGPRARG